MPAIHLPITNQGPLLRAFVGVSQFREDALKKFGLPVPQWVPGVFLVDTGASGTCIDPTLINSLGVPQTGSVSVQTPSTGVTPHQCGQYDVLLYIPGAENDIPGLVIEALPIIETTLSHQGIDGLIGRDVLDRCTLIYNAGIKTFTLAY